MIFLLSDFGDAVPKFIYLEVVSMKKQLFETKHLVRISLLGAMGFALMYLEFPLPFLPVFLKYDFGDMPALFAGFAMGPVAGFLTQLIKVMIFFLSGKGDAGLIGATANLVAGGSLTLAASIVYRNLKIQGRLPLAMIAGTIVMVVVTTIANIYFFLPLYGIPVDQIMPFVYAGTIPFNLVKGLITSVATILLYSRFRRILHT
jgi:riboflavin transporter